MRIPRIYNLQIAALVLLAGHASAWQERQPDPETLERHSSCTTERIAAEYVTEFYAGYGPGGTRKVHSRERCVSALLWLYERSKAMKFAGPPADLRIYAPEGPEKVLERWHGGPGMLAELAFLEYAGLEGEMEAVLSDQGLREVLVHAMLYLTTIQTEEAFRVMERFARTSEDWAGLASLACMVGSGAKPPYERSSRIMAIIASRSFPNDVTRKAILAQVRNGERSLHRIMEYHTREGEQTDQRDTEPEEPPVNRPGESKGSSENPTHDDYSTGASETASARAKALATPEGTSRAVVLATSLMAIGVVIAILWLLKRRNRSEVHQRNA